MNDLSIKKGKNHGTAREKLNYYILLYILDAEVFFLFLLYTYINIKPNYIINPSQIVLTLLNFR